MYTSLLISVVSVATFAAAIPIPLTIGYDNKPAANDLYAQNIEQARVEANKRIQKMKDTVNNPIDATNKARIETAFGPIDKLNMDHVKDVIGKLESGNLQINTADPTVFDKAEGQPSYAQVSLNLDSEKKFVSMGSTQIGSKFHTHMAVGERAGTLIHEATHQLSHTGDDASNGTGEIIPSNFGHPGPPQVFVREGYAKGSDGATVSAETLTTDQGASLKGGRFEALRNASKNMSWNADSYRVLSALCARSLYKRALTTDDPVQYYLSKREQCSLPPDYFKKKAAAKVAAEGKGIINTIKPTTQAAEQTKSMAKGALAFPQIKGAKGAQGLKAVKGQRGVNASKVTTVVRSPFTKGSRTNMDAKALGSTRGTKADKGAKVTTGSKVIKNSNAVKGEKSANAMTTSKGHRTAQGIGAGKAVKSTKADSNAKGGVTASKNAGRVPTASLVSNKDGGKATRNKIITPRPKAVAPRTAQKTSKAAPKTGAKITPLSAVIPAAGAVVSVPKKGGKKTRRDLESVLDALN
ncbi:hypothetical protein M408DRAFT_26265 [Serendipita vermifera MAFF 305830]|uniref:Lysine-specific metallo-endopeptidase domain-containing protein n=1 Tax=Serendipita vermifera MAFF 305830 TaxID=933852 RepID=A0A0C3AZT6_SERVB|nr:hypothetical protein M408DRAFT_26265 [Serendipita vermifera MAFF 305830]